MFRKQASKESNNTRQNKDSRNDADCPRETSHMIPASLLVSRQNVVEEPFDGDVSIKISSRSSSRDRMMATFPCHGCLPPHIQNAFFPRDLLLRASFARLNKNPDGAAPGTRGGGKSGSGETREPQAPSVLSCSLLPHQP